MEQGTKKLIKTVVQNIPHYASIAGDIYGEYKKAQNREKQNELIEKLSRLDIDKLEKL